MTKSPVEPALSLSNGDDWKLPGNSAIESPRSAARIQDHVSISLFSRPCETFRDGRSHADSSALPVLEPFNRLLRRERHESKRGKWVPLDTGIDSYRSWTLPLSPDSVRRLCSTTSPSTRVPSADLCGCHRAHPAKQRVGIWRWGHRARSLELPQFVRNPSHAGRGRTLLVSSAHRPSEPAGYPDGAGWRRGAFPAYPCLHGGLPSVAPCPEGLGEVLCRRFAGFSLYGSDCRHHSSPLAAPNNAINIEVHGQKEYPSAVISSRLYTKSTIHERILLPMQLTHILQSRA